MAEGKDKIIFYTNWCTTFQKLTVEEAGNLIKHFCDYVTDLNPEPVDRMTELLFDPIKDTLKRDLKKWQQIAERNKINGLKGGRPENPPEPKITQNNPVGFSGEKNNPEKPVKVNVSVTGNVTDKVSGNEFEVDSTEVSTKPSAPPKPKRSIFIPPQLLEVQNYCIERQNKVDPEQWHNHYTANGWMVGRSKMKDWKAAVRTWEKNDFNTAKNGAATYTPKTRDQINREESDARRKRIMAKFQPESGSQDQANGLKTNGEMDEGFTDWSTAD